MKGRVRVDYALFESAAEAASAANAAALLTNNATMKIEGDGVVGDATWKTTSGSPALIVERGPAVIYVSAQGDESISESDLANVAARIIQRVDAVQLKISPQKLACDIETYLGLNLIKSQTEKLRSLARELARGGSSSQRAVQELKAIVNAEASKGIRREAAVNLIQAASSLSDQ